MTYVVLAITSSLILANVEMSDRWYYAIEYTPIGVLMMDIGRQIGVKETFKAIDNRIDERYPTKEK